MDWFILAFGAAFLTAAASIVEKKTLMNEHAMSYSAGLAVMNVVVALFFIPKLNLNFPFHYYIIMFIAAFFGALGYLFLAKSFRHMEISVATPLLNFSPAFLAIVAYIFLGETLGIWQIVGILFLIIGAYVVEVDHDWKTLKSPFIKMVKSKYVHFIFFGLFFYTICSLIDRYVLRVNNFGQSIVEPITYIFIVQIFILINFIILSTIYYNGIKDIGISLKNNWHWLFIIALFTVGYRLLQAQAIAIAYVSLVIPIKRLSTLIATIFGGRMFHEKGLGLKIIGTIIMLAGVVLIVVKI